MNSHQDTKPPNPDNGLMSSLLARAEAAAALISMGDAVRELKCNPVSTSSEISIAIQDSEDESSQIQSQENAKKWNSQLSTLMHIVSTNSSSEKTDIHQGEIKRLLEKGLGSVNTDGQKPQVIVLNETCVSSPSGAVGTPPELVIEDVDIAKTVLVTPSSSDEFLIDNDTHSKAEKKRRTSKENMLKFPPCVICGGTASGLHYGCNTCEACKNFYRRYLIGKQTYVCMKNSACEISFKNRGNCSACRLAKCLVNGMSKDKSKMGRYSYTRRTETIKKVKEIEEKQQNKTFLSSSLPSISNSSLCNSKINNAICCSLQIDSFNGFSSGASTSSTVKLLFDEETIAALKQARDEIKPFGEEYTTQEEIETKLREYHTTHLMKLNTFGTMSNVSMEQYRSLLSCGIDIDDQFSFLKASEECWSDIIGRYCKFAKCIPSFSKLSYDDQSSLLKATHSEFFILLLHRSYIEDLGVYMEIGGKPFHIDEVANKFFSREVMAKMFECEVYFQKLDVTEDELLLLVILVTMSPDICKLENYHAVEEVQLSAILTLQHLIYSRMGRKDANKRFTKFIDGLMKLRDMAAVYYKTYQNLCNDEMLMKEVPTIASLLPDEY